MTITKQITLDVSRPNNIPSISAKQFDEDSRFLKINLVNGTEDISVESDSAVLINIARADGESNSYNGSVNEDGSVTVPLSNWLLSVEGTSSASVSIIQNGERLTSLSFDITVQPCESAAEPTEDDSNVWDSALSDIAKLKVDDTKLKGDIADLQTELENKVNALYDEINNTYKGIGYKSKVNITDENYITTLEYKDYDIDAYFYGYFILADVEGDVSNPTIIPRYEPLDTDLYMSMPEDLTFHTSNASMNSDDFIQIRRDLINAGVSERNCSSSIDWGFFSIGQTMEPLYWGALLNISYRGVDTELAQTLKPLFDNLYNETLSKFEYADWTNEPKELTITLKEV